MKRTMMIAALFVAAMVFGVIAENVVRTESFLTIADRMVTTNEIEIAVQSDLYREIEKVVVKNNGAATATIVVSICEKPKTGVAYAVYTPLATYTLATGASTNDFPLRTSTVKHLAKNLRVVATLSATNAVQNSIDYYIYGKR